MSVKVASLAEKPVAELHAMLAELSEEHFKLRMQMGSEQGVRTHLFSRVRKDIARVKTVLSQKGKQGERV